MSISIFVPIPPRSPSGGLGDIDGGYWAQDTTKEGWLEILVVIGILMLFWIIFSKGRRELGVDWK